MMNKDEKIAKFIKYLLKWNQTHKLTNYKTRDEIKRQIEDSIYPVKFLDNIKSAIDIGTGAGFPGIPLAIEMQDVKWYLVEPLQKRFAFLNYLKIALNLKNVEIIPKRIEQFQKFKVDLITSRAVSDINTLLKLSNGFYDENTIFLFYKGENVYEELKDIPYEYKIIENGKRNYLLLKGVK